MDSGSIAVLPFDNRSKLEDDIFFTEGIHDELLSNLAQIGSLKVISRTSEMRYQDTLLPVPQIGSELGVATILEGAVQRDGDQVRVNAQLIDSLHDTHLWAETFDRELSTTSLFAIQSDIARAITAALNAELSNEDRSLLETIPTQSFAAYDAYLRGRQNLLGNSIEAYQAALVDFDEAITQDSSFAGAYAGECETQLGWYRLGGDINRFKAGESACQKALSIDPDMTEVRIALGQLYRNAGDYERAAREIRQALDVEEDNVDALIELGFTYQLQGRTAEAEQALVRATEVAPGNWQTYDALAFFYQDYSDNPQAGQLALNYARKVVELNPLSASAYNNLGTAYHRMGQYADAVAAWDRALELEPTRTAYTNRGLAYYYDGHFEEAARMQLKAIELAPSDHRAWGRLAESWRFVEGREQESRQAYQSAIALAEPQLEINEKDWKTRGLLATYYVHADQPEGAIEMIDTALQLSDRHPEALLYQALVLKALGDTDGAKQALAEAVEKDPGYQTYVDQDPDLRELLNSDLAPYQHPQN